MALVNTGLRDDSGVNKDATQSPLDFHPSPCLSDAFGGGNYCVAIPNLGFQQESQLPAPDHILHLRQKSQCESSLC